MVQYSKCTFVLTAMATALVGVGLAGATPATSQSAAPSPKDAAASATLATAERLRIRVWGNQELSGDYTVDADNTVSLPAIGRTNVAALTVQALEETLASRMSAVARRDVSVSVEVTRFRPYFVVGRISEPGSAEWRPGLNVVQAVALAGGIYRPMASVGESGALGARVVLTEQSRTQLRFALAQLARLKAERDGTQVDSDLIASAHDRVGETSSALSAVLARQNAILSEQRASLQSQLAGLEREREAAIKELEVAEQQDKAVVEQLDLARSMLRDVEDLKDKKLIANTRYMAQRTELMTSEVRAAETRALVERTRSRINATERQMTLLKQERRNAINERIENLEREVAQLEISLGNTGVTGTSTNTSELTFQIARPRDGQMETFVADLFTPMFPGDVLVVSDSQRPIAAGTALSAEDMRLVVEGSGTSRSGTSRTQARSTGTRTE